MEKPDYDKFKTVESVDREIEARKNTVCNKVKMHGQIKQQKKDSNAAFNDQLKSLSEEIDFEIEVIDEFKRRIKELDGTDLLKVQPIRA